MRRKLKQLSVILLMIVLIVTSVLSNLLTVKAATTPSAYSIPTLTGNQRSDVANIAKSQVGYVEGSGDLNIYGKEFGRNGEAWCAYFVIWCYKQAGIEVRPTTGSTTENILWFQNRGQWHNKQPIEWKWNNKECDGVVDSSYVPQVGDYVAVENDGYALSGPDHTAIVVGVDASWVYTVEGNISNSVVSRKYSRTNFRLNGNSGSSTYISGFGSLNLGTTSYNPQGALDEVSSEYGKIRVRGWAFDRDALGEYLNIQVYVGGTPESGAPCYVITANQGRQDVEDAYPGVGSYHGFDSTIKVSARGETEIYVYAMSVGGGYDTLLGTKTVNITNEYSISVDTDNLTLKTGETKELNFSFTGDNVNSMRAGSNNNELISLESWGEIDWGEGTGSIKLKGVDPGEIVFALILVDEDVNYLYVQEIKITIVQPVLYIGLNDTSLNVGETEQLKVKVYPSTSTNKNIIWSSSNTNVVTVSEGTITAKSAGTATITATAEDGSGATDTCTVTVTQPVTGVSLNKTSIILNVGATENLTVTVSPATATNKNVTWSSSNTTVATVSGGKITAVGAGTATITANAADSSGKTATCTVTVKQPVTGLSLNKTSTTLNVGATESLAVTVSPSNATDKSVAWSSSNTNVATVSGGAITAKSAGTATITATAADGSGKTASCTVTVKSNEQVSWPEQVKLRDGNFYALIQGMSTNAYLNNVNNAVQGISQATDDSTWWYFELQDDGSYEIKSKTNNYNLTLRNGEDYNGNVICLAKDSDVSEQRWYLYGDDASGYYMRPSCTEAASLDLRDGSAQLYTYGKGEEQRFRIVIGIGSNWVECTSIADYTGNPITPWIRVTTDGKPENALIENIDYTVSYADNVNVGTGKVIITGIGKYAGSRTITFKIAVVDVESVKLSMSNVTLLDVGWQQDLSCIISPNVAVPESVIWTSSNTNVAMVEDGVITSVAPGTAVISVTVDGKTAQCNVTVYSRVTGVSLNASTLNLKVNDTFDLVATVTPDFASDKTVNWYTSNSNVAIVEDGKVTALKPGTAQITVTANNGMWTSCIVNVAEKQSEVQLGDVSVGSWQYAPAIFVYQRGIMTGKGLDTNGNVLFDPDAALTREQFAQILYSAEGKESIIYAGTFVDVKDNQWYTSAVLWAADNGIVSGYGEGRFGVGDSITREQLAAMLYKYAVNKGYDTSARAEFDRFNDVHKISPWATEQLSWAVANGIMSGKGEGLDPTGSATRAECAAMLKAFLLKFEAK